MALLTISLEWFTASGLCAAHVHVSVEGRDGDDYWERSILSSS